eukprot:jgi/Psemu1/59336/gm1.59336_g
MKLSSAFTVTMGRDVTTQVTATGATNNADADSTSSDDDDTSWESPEPSSAEEEDGGDDGDNNNNNNDDDDDDDDRAISKGIDADDEDIQDTPGSRTTSGPPLWTQPSHTKPVENTAHQHQYKRKHQQQSPASAVHRVTSEEYDEDHGIEPFYSKTTVCIARGNGGDVLSTTATSSHRTNLDPNSNPKLASLLVPRSRHDGGHPCEEASTSTHCEDEYETDLSRLCEAYQRLQTKHRRLAKREKTLIAELMQAHCAVRENQSLISHREANLVALEEEYKLTNPNYVCDRSLHKRVAKQRAYLVMGRRNHDLAQKELDA